MKIDNDGNWHKGCHIFDEPSIHVVELCVLANKICVGALYGGGTIEDGDKEH
jgi:hypothetical protein